MRRAAAVPVAAILASAGLDGDRAPQRADFPNCQYTVKTLDGGLGSSAVVESWAIWPAGSR